MRDCTVCSSRIAWLAKCGDDHQGAVRYYSPQPGAGDTLTKQAAAMLSPPSGHTDQGLTQQKSVAFVLNEGCHWNAPKEHCEATPEHSAAMPEAYEVAHAATFSRPAAKLIS